MQKKGTIFLMFMMLILLIINITAFNSCNTSNKHTLSTENQNKPISSSSGLLEYGQFCYDHIHTNSMDNISWSFSSSNPNVSIYVMAMDFDNFSLFNLTQSSFAKTLSPGNLKTDMGTFTPNYPDTWYIVYLNNDSDEQSTSLTYNTTLVSSFHEITITSPNNSNSWEMCSSHYIRWTTIANITYVNIEIYQGGVLYSPIINNLYNNGSYNWTISRYFIPDDNYEIVIRDANNSTINYYSNYFSIMIGKTLAITNPSIMVSWKLGSFYHIYWVSTGNISNINIYLYKDENFNSTIILNTSNNGSYFWKIPSNLPVSDYYEIKIEDASNSSIYTYSSDFYVVNPDSSGSNTHTTNSHLTGLWIFLSFLLFIIIIAVYANFRSKPNTFLSKKMDKNRRSHQKSYNSINNRLVTEYSDQIKEQELNTKPKSEIPTTICPRCGILVKKDVKNCPECGYTLIL